MLFVDNNCKRFQSKTFSRIPYTIGKLGTAEKSFSANDESVQESSRINKTE